MMRLLARHRFLLLACIALAMIWYPTHVFAALFAKYSTAALVIEYMGAGIIGAIAGAADGMQR